MVQKQILWTRDLVKKFWNGLSSTRMSRELAFSALAGEACIQVFSPFLDKKKSYLDFGGGDGAFANILCAHDYRVATYDLSEGRAEHAERLLETHKSNYLGQTGPGCERRFDGVFLLEVAEHILDEDIASTYKLITSLLEPGGLLFITTPNKEDLELGYVYEPQSGIFFHRWQHVRSLDRTRLTEMLKPFGLYELLIHEIDFRQDAFDAMNESVRRAELGNPFETMRPIYMGARSNIAAIFCNGETNINTDKKPYVITTRMVAELPGEEISGASTGGPIYRLLRASIHPESGLCFVYVIEIEAPSDGPGHTSASGLRLYEDGKALGPAHASHDDIRRLGAGAYSHWNGALYFSSSDGSNPRTNGRRYEIRIVNPSR